MRKLKIVITEYGVSQATMRHIAKINDIFIFLEQIIHYIINVKTPNKNVHLESFHRILEDEYFKSNEFQVIWRYMIPNEFYHFYF
ncbi:hypothetical protein EXM30_10110 [Clostridium botulinum]|uniref:hypothetical protein n=1 Tax=Clostridium botulinum TaxID=1491 RepID=UPI0007DEAB79|nr:hypothetical protein [Clostridium botulinum]KEI81821.1 hypothetical protein N487_13410 [Clostridium botulinum B2 331]NEZ75538.1 hypothetical protein [Clostridium botulinum]NEZ99294.1 hypothetical protein [Clostridium botulinum]NFA32162.1 hypothetical protein [Clostridium botulinum]NFA85028.1 hypothetical protein [Clostridium botulinum]